MEAQEEEDEVNETISKILSVCFVFTLQSEFEREKKLAADGIMRLNLFVKFIYRRVCLCVYITCHSSVQYRTLNPASSLSISQNPLFFHYTPMKQQKWLHGRLTTQYEREEQKKKIIAFKLIHLQQYNKTNQSNVDSKRKLLKISSGWWNSYIWKICLAVQCARVCVCKTI